MRMVDADISQFTGITVLLISAYDERRGKASKIVWTLYGLEKRDIFLTIENKSCKSEHNAIRLMMLLSLLSLSLLKGYHKY